jgi:hypothetical protein
MKFLLIVKPRTVPPPAVLSAHKGWVLRDRKQEAYHCFAASPGGMTIVTADSIEELNNKVFEAPAGPYCDIEVYPLVDFAAQMDRFAEVLERAGSH